VTIAGQSFGSQTGTGILTGQRRASTVAPVDGAYLITLPGAGATMLTLG